MSQLIEAGLSDKYGQVYVEKIGNTGFDDPTEPVALFRAQDEYALITMTNYYKALASDDRVSKEQLNSVRRQIGAFTRWRQENSEKIRVPGTKK